MVTHCGFKFHISDGYWWWASFHMSLGPLYVLLGEVSVQVFCPFFNWVVCLPGVDLCEFFIYLGDQTLSMVSFANIFSYMVGSLFILLLFSLAVRSFLFWWSPISYSFLYVLSSKGHIGENIASWNIWDFPAYVLPVSYTHLTLPTNVSMCRSRWSPYH